ncbi:MAG: choice-of-anchor I family protein, partial [Phaeodactylibacter sp.]|nr:choice-of-anchor I family protein [Phaeodactylibacter sp.]
ITNYSGTVIDEVNYNDNDPWPTTPDGGGPSLELIAAVLDNNDGHNWRASITQAGDTDVFATPGITSENLPPVISFAEASVAVEEGSGPQSLALVVNNPDPVPSQVILSVASASTAVNGEDYILATNTITFPASSAELQFVDINILDNAAPGGRYLILEMTQVVNGVPGANDKLIVLIKDNDIASPPPLSPPGIKVVHRGSYESGLSAESVAHDPGSQRLFVANARENRLDIIDFSNPVNLRPVISINLSALYDGQITSLAVYDGMVAVAMAANVTGDNGAVLFFETNGFLQSSVEVGPLPNMLVFSPGGSRLLVANEGEPSGNYLVDPEGSVSIINMEPGVGNMMNSDVAPVSFAAFNADSASLAARGVRLYGPGATVAQDLEPEYIAISDDGATAYVVCQENNALVVVDIETATAAAILPLGYKDWSQPGLYFDASDRSPDIFFANWPVKGMYQPGAIDYFAVGGQRYLITANEGDARNYDAFSEEFRVGDDAVALDPAAFPDAAYLKEDVLLGRLFVTSANGDLDGDGDFDELYAYGGRSFSIWNAESGELVYDSGSSLEVIIANDPVFARIFNVNEDENEPKGRSDDKGPEPKAVVVGVVDGVPYAFVAMERIGGVMVFELSNPAAPQYIQYINTRNLNFPVGDLSPDDLAFIAAEDSPDGKALLVASHLVSGTVAVFEAGTFATVGFATSSSVVPEGSGRLEIEVQVEVDGALDGEATVRIIGASTAVEGEDYTMANTSLVFPGGSSEPQRITLDILDNDAPGGRYLILEIAPANNSVFIEETNRHILLIQDNDDAPPVAQTNPYIQMNYLGSYATPFGSTLEIADYDEASQRLFVTNPAASVVEILDYSDPANVTRVDTFSVLPYGSGANAVAVRNGIVAVAVQGANTGDSGKVVFFDVDGSFQKEVAVGVLPDMILFSPDGGKVLTANEGEPSSDYTVDPEGSVSIIDISGGVASAAVTTLGFEAFNSQRANLIAGGVRIFGPNATVAQDLEPEHIAISEDGNTAYVTCQENNALAVIDLPTETVAAIWPLGTKDWDRAGASFDASDRSSGVFFANWPVKGLYQPDAIDFFTVDGIGYLITANEGDARTYGAFTEEFRVGDDEIVLDPTAFPDAEYLKEDVLLGRLRISSAAGDTDGDGDYDELYAYGARSFSIRILATGALIFDSDNDLEQIIEADSVFGSLFNTNDEENAFKNRSDDKGPEPETVVVAEIDGREFAFIGLERMGGIVAYEVSNPVAPEFIQYINTRNVIDLGGDLSPEGMAFIPASASPTGRPMLVVAYEVSGTVALFDLQLNCSIASLPDEVSFCEGQPGLLEVSGAYEQIAWSTGEMGPSIAVSNEGPYTVTATTASGCVATDTVAVSFTPLPAFDFPQDTLICADDVTIFEPGSGNAFIIDGIMQDAFIVEGFAPGAYSVEAIVVSDLGCQLPAELNFTIDICAGTQHIAPAEAIELSPNPTAGLATVRLRNLRESVYHLQVANAAGQLISHSRVVPLQGEYRAEIDLSAMPPGIYLVRLVSGSRLLEKRLVVE